MTIGQRIRETREGLKWPRRTLALKSGYTEGSIYDWERGACKPSERAIRALEVAFGKKLRK